MTSRISPVQIRAFCPGRARHSVRADTTKLCLFVAASALLTGCSHLGPRTVAVDRFDYSTAIADSWKQQTLLNIVKLRYMDLPVFVDVASVVGGYSLETGFTVGGSLPQNAALGGNTATLGGAAKFIDRPTITYVPLTGEKFLRGLITPIDPKNIFFMLQGGYPADFLLGLTVESLNGVRNRSAVGGTVREADPEFTRALVLMREVQAAGAVGMRVEEDKSKGQTAVLFFRRDDLPADMIEKSGEIRRLLGLPADQTKFTLVYSPARGAGNELAVHSRSMLQILQALASYVDVPEAHRKEQAAMPASEESVAEDRQESIRIHSGKTKPVAGYAAVQYRGHWFWIENDDWRTKRALTAVIFFFTLAETGGSERLPLVTIPAQ